jgi:hypothetical protein
MRTIEGHENDRELTMELTRGVTTLASTVNSEEAQFELFMGLFHPEVDRRDVRKLAEGMKAKRGSKRTRY